MTRSAILPGQVSVEDIRARLQARLGPKDKLAAKGGWLYQLRVDRSAGVGVVLRVKPAADGTKVTVMAFVPSIFMRLIKSFVLWVFLGRKWRAMEEDVLGWVTQSAPAPNPPAVRPASSARASMPATTPATGARRIACPKCRAPFTVAAGATRVQCPACGAAGAVR